MTFMDRDTFYHELDEMLEVASGTVKGSDALGELESWDSLAVISFIAMVDSQYGVSLPAKAITACRTAADLAKLVEENRRA